MKNEVFIGDCAEVLKQLPDESIDCIVTDPPYGYSFMGLQWDKALPSEEALRECCRVLKAGAFGFFMCAPRQDVLSRMIIRLEDAGFNVGFSSIYWSFSSGFPKAANASKIADKRLGAEREVIGIKKRNGSAYMKEQEHYQMENGKAIDGRDSELIRKRVESMKSKGVSITTPSTPEAQALDGSYLGFQPKPALECVILAEKPLSIEAQLTIITSRALCMIGELEKCLDLENPKFYISANNAEMNFTQHQIVKEYFAQRNAMDSLVEEAIVACGKVGGLYDLTDMLKCISELKEMEPQITPSNTVWLWKSILVDILSKVNKFTTETVIDLITELKILNWLLSQSIQENTIIPLKTLQNGMMLYVPIVENSIVKLVIRLKSLNQTTALLNAGSNISESKSQKLNVKNAETSLKFQANIISENENIVPLAATGIQKEKNLDYKVIITVMKPLSEKTYVDQALKNGHGVTWLGNCKIPCEAPHHNDAGRCSGDGWTKQGGSVYVNDGSRFPANLLVSDNCLDQGIITKSIQRTGKRSGKESKTFGVYTGQECVTMGHNDSGDFSRYFSLDAWFDKKLQELPPEQQKTFPFLITPKPSKSEKNRYIENKHPTVKPLKLMSYLITMGSREGDVILDPFAGSGTTLEACRLLNRVFIGIDKDPENEKYMRARGQLDNVSLNDFQEVEV